MRWEFARPDFLYLLLALPAWALLVWPRAGHGVHFSRGATARGATRLWGGPAAAILALPHLLRAGAMAALVLALAHPQRLETVEDRTLRGKGMGIVVDLSSSMLAEDMEGGSTRIDVARGAARRFAEGRTLDELSLVGFAGRAMTRVPPTDDPNLVVAGVETLQIQLVGDGTDISGALLTSMAGLIESERVPRVIVLLTDGAHNGSGLRPLAAARAAAALGIKVHSISILGPEVMDRPRPAGLQADIGTVLGGISSITGGEYFHASSGAALDSIYALIHRLEAPTEEVTERETHHSLRFWALLAALALVTVDVLLRGSRWGIIP